MHRFPFARIRSLLTGVSLVLALAFALGGCGAASGIDETTEVVDQTHQTLVFEDAQYCYKYVCNKTCLNLLYSSCNASCSGSTDSCYTECVGGGRGDCCDERLVLC